jgi:hypothetical protein
VLEQEDIATVQLASVRSYVERIRPPRALYCDFPLGRPLGLPGDPDFQHRVLDAALQLLSRDDVPVLEDFGERIADEVETPLACRLPPRFDASLHPAVDEATGLRAAYERQRARSGQTTGGHVADAAGIPDLIRAFVRIADGEPLDAVGLPGEPRLAALDVRSYYEEAAVALTDHVPAARQAESWFYGSTETGAVLKRAQAALREAGAPFEVWWPLVPLTQGSRR